MRIFQRFLTLAAILVSCPAWAQPVPSTEPSSTHIFPAGGKRGTVVKVRVGGECLPPGMNLKIIGKGVTGPAVLGPEVKARYEPSLRRVPRDADGGLANMSYPREFDVSLAIADSAEPGTRFWRVWGAWGGTRPRPFLVGDLPEFIETEPNSQAELAQRIALPVVVNGQIAGERDQDFFVFHADAGQVVVCDVMAARIGSPLEPVLAITDTQGNRVETHEIRVGTDPVVSFRAPATGDYRLHIANLSFYGGSAHVYRVTVTSSPYAPFAFPSGGRAGQTADVEVFTLTGTASLRAATEKVAFPAKPGLFALRGGLVLAAGELPEVVETSDNHSFKTAMDLTLPVIVNGRFLKADEEDWFQFAARKDDAFGFTCQAWPPASAAVPTLTILDPKGAPLAKASSAESPERGLELDWQAPAHGVYRLRLRDLRHGSGGGVDHIYRLSVRRGPPSFSLRLDKDYVNVVPGGKAEIELDVRKTAGFTGPIDLAAVGLPEGLRLEPARISANQTRVKINLIAAADTRPTDAAVQVVGTAKDLNDAPQAKALVSSFGSVGDVLHVTVQHKPVFRLSCKETYQYAPRGTIHPYLMKIERYDGFDGPIVLQLCDRQVQDLDGVDVLETVIPAGAKEIMNRIYFPETMHASVQAHSRPYAQAYTTFTDKWGQKQVLLSVSTHRCMVRTLPPVVKLRALAKEITARPGDTTPCTLALDRAAFDGAAEVVLLDTPGVSADMVRIEAGQNEAIIRIHVSENVPRVDDSTLRFRATGALPSGATAVTEATVQLRLK